MPRTEEVALMAAQAGDVESLAGTILLDRYRLIKLLGSGGAAAVYEAEHSIMHKRLAVKVLRPECAVREEFVRRFIGEARMVARLRHEHIVDVVDIGRTENGIVFCVMEYLDGETLADTLLRDGPMPLPRASAMMMQVCSALAAAHAVQVVHRDVKPENCFRTRRKGDADFIKLLDFGIAKQLDAATGLTNTGVVMGTAEYMSPEQARGSSGVDARADVYSVGAMLFELLTGLPPFMGDGFLEVLMKHATEPIPTITSLVEGLPPAMDLIIERALAKKAADRFSTMEEFMTALAAVGEQTVVAPCFALPIADAPLQPVSAVGSFMPRALSLRDPTPVPSSFMPSGVQRDTGGGRSAAGFIAALVLGVVLIAGIAAFALWPRVDHGTQTGIDSTIEALDVQSRTGSRPASGDEPRAREGRPTPRAPEPESAPPQADPPGGPPSPAAAVSEARAQVASRDTETRGSDDATATPIEPGAAHRVAPKTPARDEPAAAGRVRTAARKSIERRLKLRVQGACKRQVFEPKTIVVTVPKIGDANVRDTPHPYAALQQCVRQNLGEVPPGSYSFRVERQP